MNTILAKVMLLFIHGENDWYLSVYVSITARPLFRGHTTPRRLSELTDDDGHDEKEKQKTSIL